MKKILIPIIIAVCLMFSGTVYAWRIIDLGVNDSKVDTSKIISNLDFEFDNTVKGIPGESILISKKNTIIKKATSEPIAFKIVYKIDEQGRKGIEKLELKNFDSSLIKDPKSTDSEIIFYGTINDSNEVQKKLGDLYVEFKTLGNEISNEAFNITASYISCQKTSAAIVEILGIEPVGAYQQLLK